MWMQMCRYSIVLKCNELILTAHLLHPSEVRVPLVNLWCFLLALYTRKTVCLKAFMFPNRFNIVFFLHCRPYLYSR